MLQLTFVGTGVSCAVPVIGHFTKSCACSEAINFHDSPNRRNNVSLMITLTTTASVNEKLENNNNNNNNNNININNNNNSNNDNVRILIDAGKTFRDAYFRVLAPMQVRYVDVLLITHAHADAMQCVEQVCELHKETRNCLLEEYNTNKQQNDSNAEVNKALSITHTMKRCQQQIPTYLTLPTLEELERISPEIIHRAVTSVNNDSKDNDKYSSSDISNNSTERETNNQNNDNCYYYHHHSLENDTDVKDESSKLELHVVSESKPEKLHINAINQFMQNYNIKEKICSSTSEKSNDDEELHLEEEQEEEFPFYSLPVEHGKNYISLGFVFGRGVAFRSAHASEESVADKSCVVYISDVSTIIEPSMSFLHDLVKIDVLIIDCLHRSGKQSSIHFCVDDVIKLVITLKPKQVYTVGMFCDIEQYKGEEELRILLHNALAKCNDYLATNNVGGIHVAYDGLQLVLPLEANY